MMDSAEVLRRLRAFFALPEARRPLTMHQLAVAAGEDRSSLYSYVRGTRSMGKVPTRRLAYVFGLLEEGRLAVVEEGPRRKHVIVVDPRPQRELRRVLTMTPEGPRLQLEAVNPHAFPLPPSLFRHKIGR